MAKMKKSTQGRPVRPFDPPRPGNPRPKKPVKKPPTPRPPKPGQPH